MGLSISQVLCTYSNRAPTARGPPNANLTICNGAIV